MAALNIKVEYEGKTFDLEVDPEDGVEILKMQIASLTDLEADDQVITGLGSGPLQDLSNLAELGLKEAQVLHVKKGKASCAVPPSPAPAPAARSEPLQQPGGITLANLSQALAGAARQKTPLELERERGMAEMQQRIQGGAQHVLIYERPEVQAQALREIPVEELKKRARDKPDGHGPRDALVRALMAWFKHECFQWVNNAPCDNCMSTSTTHAGGAAANTEEKAFGANAVELYKCTVCSKIIRFPRYNHPGKLMQTKRGRCGEWANAFTLCCIAMGFEARHVVDWTDHVWTEVYSEEKKRWIHMDPCENAWDSPLLYCEGWNKKLTYVIAFSKEEVVDVTARYTRKYNEALGRRTRCPELWLAEFIASMRQSKLAHLPPARRVVLQERWGVVEAKELEPRNLVNKATWEQGMVLPGRQSGSVAWRAARGELGNTALTAQGGEQLSVVKEIGEQEMAGTKLSKSGVHGQSHPDSSPFDDVEFLGERVHYAKLRGFTVWAGDRYVHGIQAHYFICKDECCTPLDGPAHLPPGDQPAPKRFNIDVENEYISNICGRSGAVVDQIEFKIVSKDGKNTRAEAFGGSGGTAFRFDLPGGHTLIGLYGALGGHMHNVGLYALPPKEVALHVHEKKPAAVPDQQAPAAQGAGGTGAVQSRMSSEEEKKLHLQQLVRHFFFEIQNQDPSLDPNSIAAKAIQTAREWVQTHGDSLKPSPT